ELLGQGSSQRLAVLVDLLAGQHRARSRHVDRLQGAEAPSTCSYDGAVEPPFVVDADDLARQQVADLVVTAEEVEGRRLRGEGPAPRAGRSGQAQRPDAVRVAEGQQAEPAQDGDRGEGA